MAACAEHLIASTGLVGCDALQFFMYKTPTGGCMEIEITVFNPGNDKKTSFADFEFNHINCGKITQRKSLISGDYELRCACGLEIIFKEFSIPKDQIIKSVIDGKTCTLMSGNYSSIPVANIKIVPKENA